MKKIILIVTMFLTGVTTLANPNNARDYVRQRYQARNLTFHVTKAIQIKMGQSFEITGFYMDKGKKVPASHIVYKTGSGYSL